MPAENQKHKGLIVGNAKKNAERNAELKGVSDRVTFRQCDARRMPFDTGSFDIAASSFALHQMIYFGKDGYRVLDEIRRILRPGGWFVNADAMIGRGMIEYLGKNGFAELRIDRVVRIGPFAVVKVLSTMKCNEHPIEHYGP